jgi:hypothetical protein
MQKTSTTITEYIDSLPAERQADIRKLDELITAAIPAAPKVMWEGVFWGGSEQKIIGYGNFSYKKSDKQQADWFIAGLALQKNYISIFLNAVEDKQYLAEKYKAELGKVKVGKSSISFNKLEDVNIDKLLEMIKKGYDLMR